MPSNAPMKKTTRRQKSSGIFGVPNASTVNLFRRKLESIHSNLMESHRDSSGYSSPIIGAEREAVNKKLLSVILPPGYRVGSGSITDAEGRETGQIDAVIEQPFSLSFPVVSETNRLYLADTVGAAFEIKSNLDVQGKDALNKIREIRSLRQHDIQDGMVIKYDRHMIPSFIIGFKGPKTIDSLEKFIDPLDALAPNGVFVIESALFYGRAAGGDWFMAQGKVESVLGFLSCVIESMRFGAKTQPDMFRYASLLKGIDVMLILTPQA